MPQLAWMTLRPVLFVALLSLILLLSGCKSYSPMEEAQLALSGTDQVSVLDHASGIHFIPTHPNTDLGFLFYPGANIDPVAYAPLMLRLAEQGMITVIARFPLNLAILAPKHADQIREQYMGRVQRWVMSGHSLGGAMAIRYIKQSGADPTDLPGLVLLAAYPAKSDSIADIGSQVLSLSASEDGLSTPEEIEAASLFLPPHTQFLEIAGGNHAQFGWYGDQDGDLPATISRAAQQDQILIHILNLINDLL